jgi:hypothetical protein
MAHKSRKSGVRKKHKDDVFTKHHGAMTRREWSDAKKQARKDGTIRELLLKHKMSYAS